MTRRSIGTYAVAEGLIRKLDHVGDIPDMDAWIADLRAWRCMVASHADTEGYQLELASEPGRALSETEACDAIRAGLVVEVVG
jgi:hypothetical protein